MDEGKIAIPNIGAGKKKETQELSNNFSAFLKSIDFQRSYFCKSLNFKDGSFREDQKKMILRLANIGGYKENFEGFIDSLKKTTHFGKILCLNGLGNNEGKCVELLQEKALELEPSSIDEYVNFLEDSYLELSAIFKEKEAQEGKTELLFMESAAAEMLKDKKYSIRSDRAQFRSDFRYRENGVAHVAVLDLYVVKNGMKYAIMRELESAGKFYKENLERSDYGSYAEARGASLGREQTEKAIAANYMQWLEYKKEIEDGN